MCGLGKCLKSPFDAFARKLLAEFGIALDSGTRLNWPRKAPAVSVASR